MTIEPVERELKIKYGRHHNPAQARFFNSRAYCKAFVGGYGSGKSHALVMEVLKLSFLNAAAFDNPALAEGMVIAPTRKMLRRVLLPIFKRVLTESGIKFSYQKGDMILTPEWGAPILLESGHDPDKIKGGNMCYVAVDEPALMQRAIWHVAVSRPRLAQAARLALVFTGTWEPDAADDWFYDLLTDADFRPADFFTVSGRTADNLKHLAPGYLDILLQSYDPDMAAVYTEGLYRPLGRGQVYRAFRRDVDGVPANLQPCPFNPELPVIVGMDFNYNPMTAVCLQQHENGRTLHQFDEIVVPNFSTADMAKHIREDKVPQWQAEVSGMTSDQLWSEKFITRSLNGQLPLTIWADATGKAIQHAVGTTDFAQLRNYPDTRRGYNVKSRTVKNSRDPINSVNGLLCNAKDERRYFVDPRCRFTLRALEKWTYEKGTSKPQEIRDGDAVMQHQHIGKCLWYAIHGLYPIEGPPRTRRAVP